MPERQDAVAGLLERLLADPQFRAHYRRDPAAAARAAGFGDLAPELALPDSRALETLEVRESRQGLAGVMMAAAVEGAAVMAFYEHVLPQLGDLLPGVEEAHAATPHQGNAIADQLGVAGSGGAPTPETLALLKNDNVTFDASGIADLKAGRIDPRVVSVLDELAGDHKLVVSSMCSDHPKLTAGGSVSNHYYGRAFDIAAVDGKPVNASNAAAREVAVALDGLDASIRPSEIGSPWVLLGSSHFSDAGHQDHLHVGFDDPIPAQWEPPEGDAADAGSDAAPASSDGDVGRAEPAGPADAAGDDAGSAGDEDAGDEDDEDAGDEEGGDEDAEGPAAPAGEEDENEPDENEPDEDEPDEADEGPDVSDGDTGEDPDSHDDNSDAQPDVSDGDSDEDPDSHDDDSDADQSSDDSDDDSSGGGEADPDGSPPAGDPLDYPGDDAERKEIAAWMGDAAQRRGLPRELPVMAALVESGMTNVGHGDADSVGFFQMRTSIWDSSAYAGYADKPQLQLQWFLDTAERVQNDRKGRGLPLDADHYGEWIADVERPAARYRGRYQLRLEEARELLRKADGGHGAGLVDAAADSAGLTAGKHALTALAAAERQLGVRYAWGGSSPQTGFDCSGLVQWAYRKAGIELPRVSEDQIGAAGGKPVSRHALLPGDLVFFRNASGDVHHVGISLGGDKFIAAPHSGGVVDVSSLDEPYYGKEFVGGRRFDQAVRGSTSEAHARVLPVVNP